MLKYRLIHAYTAFQYQNTEMIYQILIFTYLILTCQYQIRTVIYWISIRYVFACIFEPIHQNKSDRIGQKYIHNTH
jgi:hypothetical protein